MPFYLNAIVLARPQVVNLIMKLGISEKWEIMSIIKEEDMKTEHLFESSENAVDEYENSQCVKYEVQEWKRLYEEQSTKLQGELAQRDEECFRLRQQVLALQIQPSIVKEQNRRILELESSLRKYDMDG